MISSVPSILIELNYEEAKVLYEFLKDVSPPKGNLPDEVINLIRHLGHWLLKDGEKLNGT